MSMMCMFLVLSCILLSFTESCMSSLVSRVDDYLHEGAPTLLPLSPAPHLYIAGGQYMVVDCGGGTVDITVHEVSNKNGHIKEVFKATGGPYGSTSIYLLIIIILK